MYRELGAVRRHVGSSAWVIAFQSLSRRDAGASYAGAAAFESALVAGEVEVDFSYQHCGIWSNWLRRGEGCGPVGDLSSA
jgi:hypothetical protein